MKVSVIIPFYNMQEFIEETLQSALEQSLSDIEIICINDGSTDNSVSIITSYALCDKRIKLLSLEHLGAGNARNIGIAEAKGEYIAFLDADDKFFNSFSLEILYSTAKKENVLICGGSLMEFDTESTVLVGGELNKPFVFANSQQVAYNNYQFDFGFTRFIYNREFLLNNKISFPHYKRYQDVLFFVKAMFLAKEFYSVPNVVYLCRVNHKKTIFDHDTVNDILLCMLDVITFAQTNDLNMLSLLTLNRINDNYYYKIMLNSLIDRNYAVLTHLNKIKQIANCDINLLDNIHNFINIMDIHTDINKILEQHNANKKEIIAIRSSFSLKLGLFLTAIPRYLTRIFTKRSNKNAKL